MRTTNGQPGTTPTRAGRSLVWGLSLASALALNAGCQTSPQDFINAFDSAVASGDTERVAQLLTPESRPLLLAMLNTPAGPRPDPAVGTPTHAGPHPFAPAAFGQRTALLGVRAQSDGSLLLQVESGDERREWVVRSQAGVLLLDLLATSARSTWPGG